MAVLPPLLCFFFFPVDLAGQPDSIATRMATTKIEKRCRIPSTLSPAIGNSKSEGRKWATGSVEPLPAARCATFASRRQVSAITAVEGSPLPPPAPGSQADEAESGEDEGRGFGDYCHTESEHVDAVRRIV